MFSSASLRLVTPWRFGMAGESAECWLNELLSQGSTLYFHLSRDVSTYMRYLTIAYTS